MSFFAFQDILFGTIGIILMIMIVMVLLVGSAYKNSLAPISSGVSENEERRIQLIKKVDSLQSEKMTLESIINTDLSRRESNLKLDLEEVEKNLEQLETQILVQRATLEKIARDIDVDGKALRALELLKTRDELTMSLVNLRKNPRIAYQIAEKNGQTPLIIEIHRGGIIITGTSTDIGERRYDKGIDFNMLARALANQLANRRDIEDRYLLFVVKPSGIEHYRLLSRIISEHPVLQNLPVGLDLLPESQSTSDAFLQEERK